MANHHYLIVTYLIPERSRSPPRTSHTTKPPKPAAPTIDWAALEGLSDEEVLSKVMGFGKFKTTKQTKVPGNDRNYGVSKKKETKYRQYMNREGGFNRPLSPGK
jgi:U4/U6.U5 tri-snRNP-associated protein 3